MDFQNNGTPLYILACVSFLLYWILLFNRFDGSASDFETAHEVSDGSNPFFEIQKIAFSTKSERRGSATRCYESRKHIEAFHTTRCADDKVWHIISNSHFQSRRICFFMGSKALDRSKSMSKTGKRENTKEIKFRRTCHHVTFMAVICAARKIFTTHVALP